MLSRMLTYTGFAFLNLPVFIGNDFYYVINCLKKNHVTNFLGISDFKLFTDMLFPLEKTKYRIPNAKNAVK